MQGTEPSADRPLTKIRTVQDCGSCTAEVEFEFTA